jgi:hypothetical protein
MARFYGKVGYGEPVESSPGVWDNEITEYSYYGDVVRNTRSLEQSGDTPKLNDDISVGNSISIVADAYAKEHFHLIKYVEWSGSLWTVTSVEVRAPRLVLSLGTVYNGPTP